MNARKTFRIFSLLAALLAMAFLAACDSKEVKPVSTESKTALESFSVVEAVRQAFIKNDKDGVLSHATEAGLKSIMVNNKAYSSVKLSFTPRWVEIEEGKVTLNVSWESTWTLGDKTLEDRGMAVFTLDGAPLKISKVEGANPFVMPAQ